MKVTYDQYYQTKNLFGESYPELVAFFERQLRRGQILDVGCGQGRDALALARLGFSVVGVDVSRVGIDQMINDAKAEQLSVRGRISDMMAIDDFDQFDFVLLNSMFHFTRKERSKEIQFIQQVIRQIKMGCQIVFCIQDIGEKVMVLNEAIASEDQSRRILEEEFMYVFDNEGHTSTTRYRMIVEEKIEKRNAT